MTLLNRRTFVKNCVLAATLPTALSGVPFSMAAEPATASDDTTGKNDCHPLLSHRLRLLMSPDKQALCDQHAGKVLLLVNTASQCGFTPQFEALETLNRQYAEKGFTVLGFPSDDFRQELSTEQEVAEFCEVNYGVTFPMYQKIGVSSGNAHPLYRDLAAATGRYPNWNFNKYLVDREGRAVEYFGSGEQPLGERMIQAIESLL